MGLKSVMMKFAEKIFNTTSAPVMISNASGEIIWINDSFERRFGYCLADLKGISRRPFLSGDHEEKFKSMIYQTLLVNPMESFDMPVKCSDDAMKSIRWTTMLIHNEDDPQQKAVVVFGIENGGNNQKMSDLESAEERYRLLFENTGIGMMFIGEDTTIALVNKEFEKLTGYTKSQVEKKMSWMDLIAGEENIERMRRFHRLRRIDPTLAPDQYDTKIRNREGDIRDIMLRVTMIPVTSYSLVSLVDMTDKRLAVEAIRESEEKYRTLLDNMQDTLYRCDLKGNLTFVSSSGSRLLGYDSTEELIGMNIATDLYYNPDERALLLNDLKANGKVMNYEVTLKRKDGSPVIVSTNSQFCYDKDGKILGVEGIFSDITDRRCLEEDHQKLEQQLSQSQKMDAIGQLAGGVAHDFNNILTGIQGNASLMQTDYSPEHPHYQRLSRIEEHVKRGANLTRQLLGFARKGKYEVKTLSINDLIRKSAQFFIETRKEIEVDFQLHDDLYPAEADQGQIEQVLLNIYINAGHAMPKGGHLHIQTINVILQETDAKAFDAKQGDYVKISISDTGIGMDRETLKRIFEPFFTTKSQEGGTGLGLTSAYGIIRNHGGAINAQSEPGQGSTFNIYLPSSVKKVEKEEQTPEKTVLSGSGGILLVDDESMILDTASELLKMLGYTVYQAASGQEAVSTYRENQDRIELVILDMILPGMSGSQVLKALKDIKPDVKVILSSGYGLQGEVRNVMKMGCQGFIQKPYDFTDLSNIVHHVLFQ